MSGLARSPDTQPDLDLAENRPTARLIDIIDGSRGFRDIACPRLKAEPDKEVLPRNK